MADVQFHLYDKFRENSFTGGAIDFQAPGGNGIKCAIVTASYSLDQNIHEMWDEVNANEVSGTGYTSGGNVMLNGFVVMNSGGTVFVDLDDPAVWEQDASGFSDGRRAILYWDSGTANTSPLIGFSDDFGSGQGNVGSDFVINVHEDGIFESPR